MGPGWLLQIVVAPGKMFLCYFFFRLSSLRKKYPYLEFFWPRFSLIRSKYGDMSSYSVRIRENEDQENSEYGHFSRSDYNINLNCRHG